MRRRERGTAMLVVMLAIGSLMTAGAVLVRMQTTSANGDNVNRTATSGLYCAEAGLTAVRDTVIANLASWNGWLGTGTEPAFLASVSHDIDGNGTPDFTITLRDNDDEPMDDPTTDNDQSVFVISTCTQHPDTQTQVTELITSTGQRKLWLRTQ